MVGRHELASAGMFMSKLCAYVGSETRWTRLGAAGLNIDDTAGVGVGGLRSRRAGFHFQVSQLTLEHTPWGPSFTHGFVLGKGRAMESVFPGPTGRFSLSRLCFPASSSLERSRSGEETGCDQVDGSIGDTLGATVQNHDDPLGVTSPPGLTKVSELVVGPAQVIPYFLRRHPGACSHAQTLALEVITLLCGRSYYLVLIVILASVYEV